MSATRSTSRNLMAGEKNGLALGRPVDHAFQELAAHQGVQARGRLVQHQHFRIVGHGQRQAHLGPHALG